MTSRGPFQPKTFYDSVILINAMPQNNQKHRRKPDTQHAVLLQRKLLPFSISLFKPPTSGHEAGSRPTAPTGTSPAPPAALPAARGAELPSLRKGLEDRTAGGTGPHGRCILRLLPRALAARRTAD